MDFGAFGFWLFIAAIIVAGNWETSRREAERHETLRRIVEKTGTIDEARLKELFSGELSAEQKPGYAYRGLRIGGTIVICIGAGVATFVFIAAGLGKFFGVTQMFSNNSGWIAGIAASAAIAVVGLGMFFSSRFATPPVDSRNDPPVC